MRIKIINKDKVLCAKFRRGQFEGVLAVMNQLLKIVKAKYVFLGEKDYQQVYLIKKFIKNKFNTKIISCKTIRDVNSLPYSSRNFLLKKNELVKASIVSLKIRKLYNSIKKKFIMKNQLKFVKKELIRCGINIEYFEIRNKYNLSKRFNKKNFKIFVAFYINKVRLIDNF